VSNMALIKRAANRELTRRFSSKHLQ